MPGFQVLEILTVLLLHLFSLGRLSGSSCQCFCNHQIINWSVFFSICSTIWHILTGVRKAILWFRAWTDNCFLWVGKASKPASPSSENSWQTHWQVGSTSLQTNQETEWSTFCVNFWVFSCFLTYLSGGQKGTICSRFSKTICLSFDKNHEIPNHTHT